MIQTLINTYIIVFNKTLISEINMIPPLVSLGTNLYLP